MYAKTILQINAPTESSDVTQDDSSIESRPLGSGVSSDVSRIFIGLDHPSRMPKATINRFTAKRNYENSSKSWKFDGKFKSLVFFWKVTHKCSKILSLHALITQRFWYSVQHFSYRKKIKIFTFVKSLSCYDDYQFLNACNFNYVNL